MTLNTLLLQAQGGQGNPIFFYVMMISVMVVFYFFFMRPQQKKQKDQQKFIESVKKGDDIVTVGGIHGRIQSVDNETVTIVVDKSTKLILDKASISFDATKRIQDKNQSES